MSFAFCVLIFAFALSGCSRTVTPIVNYGDQLLVQITLRGNYDVNSNKYFMVIGNDQYYRVPLPPPDQLDEAPEFIEPDMLPQTGSRETYFADFFDTWAGYMVIDPTGYTLVNGPFTITQTATRQVIATLGAAGTRLSFLLPLDQLFSTVPDQIYFDVVSVPWPLAAEKIPADHLLSTDNSISSIVGSIVTVTDAQDPLLLPSLDILECRVEVQ